MVKDYILLKSLNTWVWKLIQTLLGSIMLMIFPLNWIEPMLFFSKQGNMLVLLIFNQCISIPVPYSTITPFKIKFALKIFDLSTSLLASDFNSWFSFSSEQCNYETLISSQGNLIKPFWETNRYGKNSITVMLSHETKWKNKQGLF